MNYTYLAITVIISALFILYAYKEQKKKEVAAALKADLMIESAKVKTQDEVFNLKGEVYVSRRGTLLILIDGMTAQYIDGDGFLRIKQAHDADIFYKYLKEECIKLGEL